MVRLCHPKYKTYTKGSVLGSGYQRAQREVPPVLGFRVGWYGYAIQRAASTIPIVLLIGVLRYLRWSVEFYVLLFELSERDLCFGLFSYFILVSSAHNI